MPYTPSLDAIAAAQLFRDNLADATPPVTAVDTLPPKALFDAFNAYITGGGGSTPWVIESKAANFTAAVGTHYRVNTTAGNVTATIPVADATNAGRDISFIKTVQAGVLILSSVSLINGLVTQDVGGRWDSVTVRSTGSTWDVVA